jgi:peroxidase
MLCSFFRPKKDFGLDLVAINMWRGRDHGLPGYNTYRQVCGLSPMTNFQDLLEVMDRSVVDRLASVYRSVNDIDLYIGGLVERHLPGSMLGPVFSCIISDQFARSKEGDRFFYEHGGHQNSFSSGTCLKTFLFSSEFVFNFHPLRVCSSVARNP